MCAAPPTVLPRLCSTCTTVSLHSAAPLRLCAPATVRCGLRQSCCAAQGGMWDLSHLVSGDAATRLRRDAAPPVPRPANPASASPAAASASPAAASASPAAASAPSVGGAPVAPQQARPQQAQAQQAAPALQRVEDAAKPSAGGGSDGAADKPQPPAARAAAQPVAHAAATSPPKRSSLGGWCRDSRGAARSPQPAGVAAAERRAQSASAPDVAAVATAAAAMPVMLWGVEYAGTGIGAAAAGERCPERGAVARQLFDSAERPRAPGEPRGAFKVKALLCGQQPLPPQHMDAAADAAQPQRKAVPAPAESAAARPGEPTRAAAGAAPAAGAAVAAGEVAAAAGAAEAAPCGSPLGSSSPQFQALSWTEFEPALEV